ncbi:MAG: response regulator [Nitrososphaerota archaeon]|jgi:DNA-binding NtrC family response regulator|nr:response regulator [Nitrososphaerota archaeon]
MIAMRISGSILLVDDDQGIRDTLAMVLKSYGHSVKCAASAKEALDMLKGADFDVLLVDIRLPDIDGIQLLHRVPDETPRSRAIVITGYPTLDNAIGAANEGADGYLLKPFEVRELLEKIQLMVESRLNEKHFDEKMLATYVKSRAKEAAPLVAR